MMKYTLALAGTTFISCTSIASGFIISTTGLLLLCVIQYISPVCPGTSDHWTNGWLLLPPLPLPLLLKNKIKQIINGMLTCPNKHQLGILQPCAC